MPSPPKPWETNTTGYSSESGPTVNSDSSEQPFNSYSSGNQTNVDSFGSTSYSGASSMAGYQNNSYTGGNSIYGSNYGSGFGAGYSSGYGSRYGSSYGGMGSYGGMSSYGGYGQPYSRQGMYSGMQGNTMLPTQEPSFMDQITQSSQSTFQLLERVVGTFGGIAQLLDSTFFATHSSFMAMVGVAEQFGLLKHMLTKVLSVFSIFRWVRDFVYKVRGKRPPVDPNELSAFEFNKFKETSNYSFKPLLVFFSLVFGIPYLLHLFMRSAARRLARQEEARRGTGSSSNPNPVIQSFEFAQAVKDFSSQNTGEISFAKGDLIAILSKEESSEPINQVSKVKWWQGRLRNGLVGLFPSNCVEILEKCTDVKGSIPTINASSTPQCSKNISVDSLPSRSYNSGQSYASSYNPQNYRPQPYGTQMYANQSYNSNRYSSYPSNSIYNGPSYTSPMPLQFSQNY